MFITFFFFLDTQQAEQDHNVHAFAIHLRNLKIIFYFSIRLQWTSCGS